MSTMTETGKTHVYEVFIKAPRETVWDALTSPEWATRYGYQCPLEIDLRAGGSYKQLPSDGMKAGAPRRRPPRFGSARGRASATSTRDRARPVRTRCVRHTDPAERCPAPGR